MTTTLLLLAAALSLSQGHPTPQPTHETDRAYQCSTFTLPVNTSNVPTLVLPFSNISDQLQATSILNTITARTQSGGTPDFVNISSTWDVEAHYCAPVGGPSSTTLQILSHGIGFNASYWDFYPSKNASDDQYSYIAAATAAGYSTLSYNRLGIQGSTLADPLTEVQASVELAILAYITSMAKAGQIPYQSQTPSKVVHIGHSFGSQLTNALITMDPDMSDGVVFTGFSHDTSYAGYFAAATDFIIASDANPSRFPQAQYPSGYVTWGTKSANQYGFLAYGEFSPDILDDAEATKQPFTIGEFLTMPVITVNATEFTKPVFYINGEKDTIMCASNCTGVVGPGTASILSFSSSSDVSSQIVPGYGHGMNLHLDAKDKVYTPIMQWLASRDL